MNIVSSPAERIAGNNDGWDYSSGTYDYAGAVTFNEATGQRIEIFSRDVSTDVSGAYGIEIEITQAIFIILN